MEFPCLLNPHSTYTRPQYPLTASTPTSIPSTRPAYGTAEVISAPALDIFKTMLGISSKDSHFEEFKNTLPYI